MDGQTITRLAKAHATLILQYTNISQVEAISLASQIIQLVAGGELGVGAPSTPSGNQAANTTQTRPTGDMEAAGTGAVLAKPGYECFCSSCKSSVYEVIAEIRGRGMGINAFCQAFRPLGHDITLTRDMLDVLKDPNGNTYINCPVCKGDKTLRLLGDAETPKAGLAPVASISKGDL